MVDGGIGALEGSIVDLVLVELVMSHGLLT